jgi:hypothetical protein
VLACTFDDDVFHADVRYQWVPVFKEVRIELAEKVPRQATLASIIRDI